MTGPASSLPELTVLARQVDIEVGKVRARADAGGGAVSVEVDAYGAITDLQLTESGLRAGAAALSARSQRPTEPLLRQQRLPRKNYAPHSSVTLASPGQ